MISTVSATPLISTGINWTSFFAHPLVLAAISSGFTVFLLKTIFNLGGKNKEFDTALIDIKDLKKDVKKLLSHMDKVVTHLVNKTGLDTGLFSSASPLALMTKGKEILNKSGFKKIYKDNKTWFIEEIKKYDVKTLADIDEASIKVMEKCRDSNQFANFKELAFQNGLPIDVFLRVLSIYLRDEAAKEILKEKKAAKS